MGVVLGPACAHAVLSDNGGAAPAPALPAAAVASPDDPDDLTNLTLEQLMSISVTSVAGVAQDWFKTPAAIYVITADDIRRTGHRTIADALRLAPGVTVGQINASAWAVGTRGFADRFTNNLQVVMDGRTLYDPLFSGVWWNEVDDLLADLERIEVIRGPGATLWGANAVNGVINITTKSAKDTQGWYLTGGVGTEEQGFGGVRYGGQINDHAWFRVYGKYSNWDRTEAFGVSERPDDWDNVRGGFRLDLEGDEHVKLTLQSDVFHEGRTGIGLNVPQPNPPFSFLTVKDDAQFSGGNFLARVEYDDPAEKTGWSLQGYYNRSVRLFPAFSDVRSDTFDVDWRHHFTITEGWDALWGLGYRHYGDRTGVEPTFAFSPSDRSLDTFSAFVQGTWTIVPDRLFAMAGSKFEHNDLSGFEVQPSGRLWWTPDDMQTIWGAISRPIRTPSRGDQDTRLVAAFAPGPTPILIAGRHGNEAEELTAYELGYRVRPVPSLTLDAATYYNDYRKLIALPQSGVGELDNVNSGESYGVELASTWRVADNWRLHGSYAFQRVQVHGPGDNGKEFGTPQNLFQVRSEWDLTKDLEFNAALYYTDRIPTAGVDGYFKLDLGVTWRPAANVEVSVWGQNLLDSAVRQGNDTFLQDAPSEIERAVYVQVTIRF